MLSTLRTMVIFFVLGFLALFLLRLGYGYWKYPEGEVLAGDIVRQTAQNANWGFASGVRNYASKTISKSVVSARASQVSGGSDQKYEKVANVGLSTKNFEDDEKRVRSLIEEKNGLIQFEERTGLKGYRLLRLAIGVDPNSFDGFVADVQKLGKLTELTINKSDKTNEYRELNAKRVSLEKARAALTELKQREGKIPDMVALEKQILDLEQQIQALGVNLGDFDTENEFVTVKLLLAEFGKAAVRKISIVTRVFKAFVWTVQYYALLWIGLVAAAVCGLIGVHLLRLASRFMKDAEAGGNA